MVAAAMALVILLACAFAVGASFGQRSMFRRATAELNGVQAMLAFNRIQDERHVRQLISQGCTDQAAEFIDYVSDQNMELLSGFVKGKFDSDAIKYLTDRDPGIFAELKTFKSKYRSTWVEKLCKPS